MEVRFVAWMPAAKPVRFFAARVLVRDWGMVKNLLSYFEVSCCTLREQK